MSRRDFFQKQEKQIPSWTFSEQQFIIYTSNIRWWLFECLISLILLLRWDKQCVNMICVKSASSSPAARARRGIWCVWCAEGLWEPRRSCLWLLTRWPSYDRLDLTPLLTNTERPHILLLRVWNCSNIWCTENTDVILLAQT